MDLLLLTVTCQAWVSCRFLNTYETHIQKWTFQAHQPLLHMLIVVCKAFLPQKMCSIQYVHTDISSDAVCDDVSMIMFQDQITEEAVAEDALGEGIVHRRLQKMVSTGTVSNNKPAEKKALSTVNTHDDAL